jgi:predicted secreted protein
MAKVNGTTILLKFWISGTLKTLVCQQGFTLNLGQSNEDASSKCSLGWTERIVGMRNYTIDVNGIEETGTSGALVGIDGIYDALMHTRTLVDWHFEMDEAHWGDPIIYQGKAFVTSFSKSAAMESPADFSLSLKGVGKLEQLIAPAPESLNATTNSAGTTISFDVPSIINSVDVDAYLQFGLSVDAADRVFDGISITGNVVTLDLDGSPITNGQTVLLHYTPGDNPVRGDLYGDLQKLEDIEVTNIVPA